MNNLRLSTKIGILVAVLVATAVVIAAVGYRQLSEVNDRLRRMVEVTSREADLSAQIRQDVLAALRGERGAVMSDKDDESKQFVEQAAQATVQVNDKRKKLATLMEENRLGEDLRQLEEFNRHWHDFQEVQKKSLPLAVLNTTTKAHALSYGKVYEKVAAFREAVEGPLRQADKEFADAAAAKDAARMATAEKRGRALLQAQTAVLELHRQLNRHIMAGFDDDERSRVEERVAALQKEAEATLAGLSSSAAEGDRTALGRAADALAEIKRVTPKLLELSRTNSNARCVQLSLGPLVKALNGVLDSLNGLVNGLNARLEDDMHASQRGTEFAQRLMVGVPAVGIPVSLALALLMTRSITRPVARGVEASEAIAKGDLTRRVNLAQRDEVGQLTQAMDRAAGTFARIVGEIRRHSEGVATSAADLSGVSKTLLAQSEESATRADQVAAGTEQMSSNINTMAAAAEEMSMNVVSISSASEEISVNVGTISAAAGETAGNVSAVADAVREATRAFEAIAADARGGAKVTAQAMDIAGHATGTMNLLDRAAGEINKVTDTIKSIALQTNLLALNATIEATSAGEAGKGFAVVAREIKELAGQSGQAAEDIARKIEGVQDGTREAVKAIRGVTEIIGQINASANRITEAVNAQTARAAASAGNLGEASKGVGHIAASIAEVAKGATDMSRNAGEAAKGANDVSRNAAEAARAAGDVSRNIHGVSKSTRNSAAGAQQVRVVADKLAAIAAELQKAVGQFKTEG